MNTRMLLATTALAVALAAMPARAQNQPGTEAQTDPASSPRVSEDSSDLQSPSATPADGLTEIVVTAQRRSENLQKAAIPVDVITGDALLNNAITQPAQLGTMVPSLSVQTGGGPTTIFFLRGVGTFATNGYSDPALAFNYDGVYVGRTTALQGLLFDLERIEVLKGPQGTLYGRNATAGAINVLPAKPRLGESSGFASVSYGNYDALIAQGAINLPLGGNAALRVSGNYSRHDGYLSDGTSDEDNTALRVQMLTELAPDFTIRLAADYFHIGGKGPGSSYGSRYVYNGATGQYSFVPSGLDPSVGLFDPAAQAYRRTLFAGLSGRTLSNLDDNVYQNNDLYGFNAEIEKRFPFGTLTVIPAYRETMLNNRFSVPGFIFYTQEKDRQASVEARFAGNRISIFDYLLGAYYFEERVKGNYTIAQQVFGAYQDFTNSTRSYALFGRLTANVSDRFRLVGGLRYTNDRKSFDGQADVINVACQVRVAGVPSCPTAPLQPVTDTIFELPFAVPALNGPPVPIGTTGAIATRSTTIVGTSINFGKITYRAAAEFDLGSRSLLYASYETGYRSGGFALAYGHETFEPEYLEAYTIGSKNRLFDNRLQLNVEAFLWKYRNQQVAHTGIDIRGNQGNFTENVGRSTNKGVEVEAELLATRNTLLSANVQYLDAVYDSYVYQVPLGTSPPAVGCATRVNAANPALRDVDCSGKPGYQSPKWTLNLGAQQTVPLGGYKIVLSADTQYKSSRYVGFEYLATQLVGETWQSNAQISFSPENDRWSLTGFVRNIEGDRITISTPIYTFGSITTIVSSPPRTYGVRGAIKF